MPAALKGVDEVYSINGALAGVFRDGKLVSGVDEDYGGDYPPMQAAFRGVYKIYCDGRAFAAVLEDGTVATWGSVEPLMMCRRRCEESKSSNPHIPRFFQLREGPVVTWGSKHDVGDSNDVRTPMMCTRHCEQLTRTIERWACRRW